jgi:hypothetical protein
LTSCSPLAMYAPPPAATPSQTQAVSTETASPSPPPTRTRRPVYTVASDALEIRSGPSEAALNMGFLARGDRVTIYRTAQAESEYCKAWAKISPAAAPARWVCFDNLKGIQP